MLVIAGRNVNNNDLGVLGGGVVVLVFSFVKWFSHGTPLAGFSLNVDGWNSGLFSFVGVLLGLAAAVLVALRVFADIELPRMQWGWNFTIFAVAALATVLILLKLLIGYHGGSRGIGLYVSLVGAGIQTVFAYFAFQASGETLPGGRRI